MLNHYASTRISWSIRISMEGSRIVYAIHTHCWRCLLIQSLLAPSYCDISYGNVNSFVVSQHLWMESDKYVFQECFRKTQTHLSNKLTHGLYTQWAHGQVYSIMLTVLFPCLIIEFAVCVPYPACIHISPYDHKLIKYWCW